MSVYLHDIPLEQAQARLYEALEKAGLNGLLGKEEIALSPALCGRVLAEAVWAKISSPHYHASAMDGFAVLASDTDGASLTTPKTLMLGEQAKYVDTGDPLPAEFNAVIMIENTEGLDEHGDPLADLHRAKRIRIREAVAPWKNIRPMGEDMVATELVLPAGHVLRPVDLGAIAAAGHTHVSVASRPKVTVIPTGTELVEIGQPLQPGDILEFNSLVLAAQVEGWGGEAIQSPIQVDDFDTILEAVGKAAEVSDLVLLNAGSSAGSEDFSASVVENLGQLLVHGVAVRPGHPVIIGMIQASGGKQVPIIGVPGYPVSAALTGEIFIEPLLALFTGREAYTPDRIEAELTRKVTSPGGDDDYMRVVVGRVGERMLVAPLGNGAGVISSLVRADGLVKLPRGSQGKPVGEKVQVRLYRQRHELEKTVFAIGSHDLSLDLIAQFMPRFGHRLVSANAGSLGGLLAIKRGECHVAGSHLLDPETGFYNWPAIDQYIAGISVRVMHLVKRQQGLLLPHGNPKNLRELKDIARPGIQFVNRQRGAGTRILLDYQLTQLGMEADQVCGYDHEEYSHLGVAARISSGRADCGLGIAAAAKALNLDFIPLYEERYDLVIPESFVESPQLTALFQVLQLNEFRQALQQLPGYDIAEMGNWIVHH